RAGGAGIPAFFTRTGVGTQVAEGKELREFDGETYVMERALKADLAIVKAWKGDLAGNLVYRKTARNFNPIMATAGKATVAEVEHLVPTGQLDPDQIMTPGVMIWSGSSWPVGTRCSTSATVALPAVAIIGLKFRAVFR